MRPSAPAGKTGLSADARQTRAVTTGRAPLPLLVPCFLARNKAPLVPPAIHAAQHERAGHAVVRARGRLYRWPEGASNSQRHGHLTRSRPQDSASNAAAPQWEPRKPLGGRQCARARIPIMSERCPNALIRKAPARSRGQLAHKNRRE